MTNKSRWMPETTTNRRIVRAFKELDLPLANEKDRTRGLKQSRSAHDKCRVELSEALGEIAHLNKIVNQLQVELEVKTKSLKEIYVSHEMAEELRDERHRLEQTISEKDKTIRQLQDDCGELSEERDHLARQVKLERLKAKDVKMDLSQARMELESVRKEYESSRMMVSNSEKMLREEEERLSDKYKKLILHKDGLELDLQNWIAVGSDNNVLIEMLHKKIVQMTKEKHDYELLLTKYSCGYNIQSQFSRLRYRSSRNTQQYPQTAKGITSSAEGERNSRVYVKQCIDKARGHCLRKEMLGTRLSTWYFTLLKKCRNSDE
eukprot:TRINITY_DN4764_c0_g7_i1.p1 TRINITY_DN4764_c0_g7~~TRINITY_DN4764_c0_g7_i1.p1  ORF type:complete len:320 (+),score=50.42 TRINITY_DN4764_c0_g7_i1:193-1152(+)